MGVGLKVTLGFLLMRGPRGDDGLWWSSRSVASRDFFAAKEQGLFEVGANFVC